jgi:hypothetical protein
MDVTLKEISKSWSDTKMSNVYKNETVVSNKEIFAEFVKCIHLIWTHMFVKLLPWIQKA